VRSSCAHDGATPVRDRPEALNALQAASSADPAEISPAFRVRRARKARSKGTGSGRGESCHRHETAEPDVGVSTDRSTDHASLRDSHQQGCGAAHSRRSRPADTGFGRAIVAHNPRSRERQSVESRSVSLRISRPVLTLGARRDGPAHASHRGLRRASRCRGWRGAVPDVQSRDSRGHGADLPQFGP
jgi:hypothetical protein